MSFFRKKAEFTELVGQTITFMEVLNDEHKIVFQTTDDNILFKDYTLDARGGFIDLIDGDPAEVLVDVPVLSVEVIERGPMSQDIEGQYISWHKFRIQTALGRIEIFVFDSENLEFYS